MGAPSVQASARDGSTFAYVVLLALAALDAAAYSVIAPVGPVISRETGAGPAVMGLLVASFPLGIVVGFALAAAGIKRRLTLQVLLISLALLAIGSLGFASGHGLAAYFAARLVMGLGSGGVWMGVTFNTLERWPGQEYLCMSRIFAAYSVGGLVGPVLGALGGVARPFAAYAGLVVAASFFVMAMGPSQRAAVFDADRAALRLQGFWLSSAGILFAVLALGLVEGILPLHLSNSLSQAGIGVLYAGISVVVAFSAALAANVGPRRALTVALLLVVTGVGAAGIGHFIPIWIAALTIVGVGIGLANTGSIGILLDAIPTGRIVTAMVAWSQIGIVGYLLGPLAGGAVAQTLGFQALGLIPLVAAIPVLGLMMKARSISSG